jgi:SAM-dependent methyltransferase
VDGLIGRLLEHPLTRGLDLDSPETTALRREIILSKPFLRAIYRDWYETIASQVPGGDGSVLEVGAGGGFLESVIPELITSEVFHVAGIDLVADARDLPFPTGSLKAIVMTNVFHHIPDVARFLTEAERTLRPGGRVIMIEPWNTGWSRFVHERFHDEPMIPEATEWEFPTSGPLSGANAALAWIVVERDVGRLESEWNVKVQRAEPVMPLRYMVSGGVSLRNLQPGWMYPFWRWVDKFRPLSRRFSVFAFIVIERLAGDRSALQRDT